MFRRQDTKWWGNGGSWIGRLTANGAFDLMVTDGEQVRQTDFAQRLIERAHSIGSWLCVGLDPDIYAMPAGFDATPAGMVALCRTIVEATLPAAAAIKVNVAFFEELGSAGWAALEEVRDLIPGDVPVIADAKRGDIANSARAYASSLFRRLRFDAATVSPYLGWDSLRPFLVYPGRAIFVLCKTSNPGSSAIQDCDVGGEPLYLRVARGALQLTGSATVGLVVGATYPEALRRVRALDRDVLLLVPGIGAQGATIEDSIPHAANAEGNKALFTVSRTLLRARSGESLGAAAERNARELAASSYTVAEKS